MNSVGILDIFVRFFGPPPANLAAMQSDRRISQVNIAGCQGSVLFFGYGHRRSKFGYSSSKTVGGYLEPGPGGEYRNFIRIVRALD